MISIDIKSGIPIYEQIVDGMKNLIIKGVLKPDEKIPSVRELGRKLTINPNTIQKAYRELERQGYIYTIIGRGNFVSSLDGVHNESKITQLKEEIEKMLEELKYLGLSENEIMELIKRVFAVKDGDRK
ncbi:GntR family transcriptional regulator [Vallitalea okinawensis]|uniref:GntR family transcriptional regulator n=1 Tax=Vallitalea okinawensis TaxID=2078660 RepID=UPI000CFD334C|nr:GntR family transcriptional regulator [Vallitalea okinawensis]